jgi:hypothetical protein
VRVIRLARRSKRADQIRAARESSYYSVVAEYYGLLGDKDKAFEYLEKNLPKRGWMKMYFRVDRRFDPLRDDPRRSATPILSCGSKDRSDLPTSLSLAILSKNIPHFVDERLVRKVGVLDIGELLEEFSLLFRQRLRRDQRDGDKQIAFATAAKGRNAM